jgi:hypothetical protein
MTVRLSNSEIQTFKECRRKWFLSYYRAMQPKQKSYTGPLAMGTRIHAALDDYYAQGVHLLDAHEDLVKKDRLTLETELRDTTALDSEAELGRIMLEGYLDWVEENGIDAELDIISTEEKISIPLFNGEVELQGKLDMRVRRKIDGVRMFRDFKAQPLSEPIATPDGWTTMGELKVGDKVLGQGFKPTTVLGVYDLGEDDIYRLEFNDGSWVRASGDHLWEITRAGNKKIVKTRELIARRVHSDRIESLVSLGEDLPDADLPIDPYLLGSLLSDGGRHQEQAQTFNVPIAQADKEVSDKISELVGVVASVTNPKEGRNKLPLYTNRIAIAKPLKDLGLSKLYSSERYIPDVYKRSGFNQRLELLRGLMDGDGLVGTSQNTVQYVTTSPILADDVAELVRSIGGWARITKNISPNYYIKSDKTKVVTGSYSWRVVIRLGINPFYAQKAEKWENKQKISRKSYRPNLEKYRSKVLKSVVSDGSEHVRCIRVDAEDSLYITRGLTLTHNTVGGSLSDFANLAPMNEQVLTYMLLEQMKEGEDTRSEGGIFTMLKKVKRTARATPPFYDQIEVRHNIFTLRSFWDRIHGVITDLMRVRKALDDGESHALVAYPTPTRDCKWKCQFFSICTMFDDGSSAEQALTEMFEEKDPYAYYESDKKGSE